MFVVVLASCFSGWPSAADDDRPNILIAISDDQSYPHASAYGCRGIATPAFDRVAREGVLFTAAIAPSPGCSPCRAAFLTGRYPWQLEHAGTHASSFDPKFATFPDLLEAAGYHVGFTGKGWGPGNWRASGRTRNPAGPEFNRRKLSEDRPAGVADTDYAANFADFLDQRRDGAPFCFWYGAKEPHRRYEKGSGLKAGKQLADVDVPPFLPDVPKVQSDILDYFLEIEWFDRHLGRMLEQLAAAGELERTLVIVTSDNGMPFPRAKANCYEYGIHMPLAIQWPARAPGGRVVDDPVSLVDLTATILAAAEVEHPAGEDGPLAMAGRSIVDILASDQSGTVDASRQYVYAARERHSSSRHDNLGYPQRAIRSREYLYIRNFAPDRWPAGDPRKFEADGALGPMHGGYHDIDACPTLEVLVAGHDDPRIGRFLQLAVAKRPAEELYAIREDPGCLTNLAGSPPHAEVLVELRQRLDKYLRDTGDPRLRDDGDIFETYPRYSPIRTFPEPSTAEAMP